MSRKESQAQQEKSDILSDWGEVFGTNIHSRRFKVWWIERDSHQKCSNSKKCCRNITISRMCNYLARLLPKVLDTAKPLWDLTCKNSQWQWTYKERKSFDETKQLLTVQPILSYYHVNKYVTIQCDVSNYGTGGVLLQEGKPITFTSRTLTY